MKNTKDNTKPPLKMGTIEDLKKMHEELNWSLEEYLAHTESTPRKGRKRFAPNK
ncbi:MAG: hypothetical protein KGV44_10900 [Flavobacteriaceae bacterium]|nr:hypothetical protein [Flavobacteriaceae bacterium]